MDSEAKVSYRVRAVEPYRRHEVSPESFATRKDLGVGFVIASIRDRREDKNGTRELGYHERLKGRIRRFLRMAK